MTIPGGRRLGCGSETDLERGSINWIVSMTRLQSHADWDLTEGRELAPTGPIWAMEIEARRETCTNQMTYTTQLHVCGTSVNDSWGPGPRLRC